MLTTKPNPYKKNGIVVKNIKQKLLTIAKLEPEKKEL